MSVLKLSAEYLDLHQRHAKVFEQARRRYFNGCRLNILVVADNFLYFNDENFGLSELVTALKDSSTLAYPVVVDTAHRDNPGTNRLNGAIANFAFSDESLKKYHQIWIMAAERSGAAPIGEQERQAIRRFMDQGGGVFATGDHEDLGVTVGGYIPRVRSMRKWFWPNSGPNGEPVAPNGTNSTRHDTNREGHDSGFSFDDQSDDVPQTISPHYFGGLIQSVHPVLCAPDGPIRVLPDHPHEGECILPGNPGGNYSIGGDSFREYPDGADGQPVRPQVIATSTMIPGAEAPELGKPPVPGGTFGAIGVWDGLKAGDYGRIVVDATWHHFINVNLIGNRNAGSPNPAVPKSMGFLHTATGEAHYERIKLYYRNIASWLTPRHLRKCWLHREIWWATQQGQFRESLRRDDLLHAGLSAFDTLRWRGPCERLNFFLEPLLEFELPIPWRGLLDPFSTHDEATIKLLSDVSRAEAETLSLQFSATLMGAATLGVVEADLDVNEVLKRIGDEESEIPELAKAIDQSIDKGLSEIRALLQKQVDVRTTVLRGLQ